MHLEHQALTPRTPRAIVSLLVPDPDQVSKQASLVPRPWVWLSRQAARGSSLTNQIARNHVIDIWIILLADYSSWRHDLSTHTWPFDSTINSMSNAVWKAEIVLDEAKCYLSLFVCLYNRLHLVRASLIHPCVIISADHGTGVIIIIIAPVN